MNLTQASDAPGNASPADAAPASAAKADVTPTQTGRERAAVRDEWPLWEVFVRSRNGLDHKHCGSLHAVDASMAVRMARDVYTRRQEGTSVWVVRSEHIVASDPDAKDAFFDPMADKVYRHPTFYALPPELDHM